MDRAKYFGSAFGSSSSLESKKESASAMDRNESVRSSRKESKESTEADSRPRPIVKVRLDRNESIDSPRSRPSIKTVVSKVPSAKSVASYFSQAVQGKRHRPDRPSANSVWDSGASLGVKIVDSRQVLKAFRLIGGFKGIQINDLREKLDTVRNEQVRKPLLKDLDRIFSRHDADKNGHLDVLEFERMVNSSTLLQSAVCELLAMADSDDFDVPLKRDSAFRAEYVEAMSISLVVLNVVLAALSIDCEPEWGGWQLIECVFVFVFSLDIAIRFYHCHPSPRRKVFTRGSAAFIRGPTRSLNGFDLSSAISNSTTRSSPVQHNTVARKTFFFLRQPSNLLDCLATISGWVEIVFYLVDLESSTDNIVDDVFWSLGKLRIFRFARLLRLVRIIFFIEDLRIIFKSIVCGMRSIVYGFVILVLIVFLWALFIRQSVASKWVDDGILRDTFPSVPQSMLVLFRCIAIGTDGSCMIRQNVSLIPLLSKELGSLFDLAWTLSQVCVLFGVLNVIAAVFVVQASEHAAEIRDSIFCANTQDDEVRLNSLDRLLRILVYPDREQIDPKEKYAAEVAAMIEREHPQAAEKIPNLQQQVIDFAKGIQESKNLLQNAMNAYEAQEFHDCDRLHHLPCLRLYDVQGEEIVASVSKEGFAALSITPMPPNADEVLLLQESSDLWMLLEEAREVQNHVKSLIFPDSAWASQEEGGISGNIWKQSKGFCDEAMDPCPKLMSRIEQKVSMKYKGNFQRNHDYCRLALVYDSVSHLMMALPKFLSLSLDSDGLEVMSLENRFVNPHPLGWRDIKLLLKARVPSSGKHHIMEMQMQLSGLRACKNENHRIYQRIRCVLPHDVVNTIVDRLVYDTSLDLGITKTEWAKCLENSEVQMLLDGLGVPSTCRLRIFDLVDIDGSGRVTSAELQELLRLFRTPKQTLELAGCHLRMKDIQRFLQTKMGPQLNKLHQKQHEAFSLADTTKRKAVEKMEAELQALKNASSEVSAQTMAAINEALRRALLHNSELERGNQSKHELGTSPQSRQTSRACTHSSEEQGTSRQSQRIGASQPASPRVLKTIIPMLSSRAGDGDICP